MATIVPVSGVTPEFINELNANFTALSAAINGQVIVDPNGNAVIPGYFFAGAAARIGFTGRSLFSSSANGTFALLNNAGTGFTSLGFGPADASHPMFKVSGATLQARLGDDSAFAELDVSTLAANNNGNGAASTAYADRVLKNMAIRATIFTSSGTYTPNANMIYCQIECLGGGGGGGGTASAAATSCSGGGGGGGGGYSLKIASKATIGASQTVTIGAAGSAGTAGNNVGGAGGDTSVGALCTGKGGSGGAGASGTANLVSAGGAGGVAGTGDAVGTGMNGGSVVSVAAAGVLISSGFGGSARWGGGGLPAFGGTAAASAGVAGTGHGSGGSGGYSFNALGTAAGGAGTAGYVVITEFCTA